MNEFEQALGAFIEKRMNLAQLREELGTLLFTNASVSDAIVERLEEEHRLGHLSSESHRALVKDVKKSISESHPTVLDFSLGATNDDIASVLTAPSTETLAGDAAAGSEAGDGPEASRDESTASRRTRRELRGGDTLNNRFVLEATIKRGGMGVVFKALDKRRLEVDARRVYVAIKALNLELSLHPDALRALQHEAFKSQALSHPNIVNVFDFDRDGDIAFITMELLEGETLASLLRRLKPEVLPKDRAMNLIRDMGAGLAYSHARGILHADFKPANVFVTKEGTAKLLDFGVARALDTQREPGTQNDEFDPVLLGGKTPAYATKEMLEGMDPDPRDDVYALACVAYQLLCGSHPYEELSAKDAKEKELRAKRIRALSRAHWRGLSRGLALDRAHRTASVTQFLADIGRRRPTSAAGILWRAAGVAALLLVAGSVALRDVGNDPPVAVAGSGLSPAETSARVAPVNVDVEDALPDAAREPIALADPPAFGEAPPVALPTAVAAADVPQSAGGSNDAGPGMVVFSSSAYSVAESGSVVRLTIQRQLGTEGSLSLQWRTIDDSARAHEDYGSFDWTTLDIEPGIESYSLYIPIVSDLKPEIDEVFRVELSLLEGDATLGEPAEAIITIIDDDATDDDAEDSVPARLELEAGAAGEEAEESPMDAADTRGVGED